MNLKPSVIATLMEVAGTLCLSCLSRQHVPQPEHSVCKALAHLCWQSAESGVHLRRTWASRSSTEVLLTAVVHCGLEAEQGVLANILGYACGIVRASVTIAGCVKLMCEL